jgi:hypothetical protein
MWHGNGARRARSCEGYAGDRCAVTVVLTPKRWRWPERAWPGGRTTRGAREDAHDAVVAPVGGIVTQVLDAGEMVAPRVPLLVVTDLDHAWANLFVPEPLMRVPSARPTCDRRARGFPAR